MSQSSPDLPSDHSDSPATQTCIPFIAIDVAQQVAPVVQQVQLADSAVRGAPCSEPSASQPLRWASETPALHNTKLATYAMGLTSNVCVNSSSTQHASKKVIRAPDAQAMQRGSRTHVSQ
jgi:hypothetical protein